MRSRVRIYLYYLHLSGQQRRQKGGRGGEVKQRDIQIGIVKLVCIFFGCVCVMGNATGMTDRKLKNMISVAETEKN